ncbi:MAG: hypothetical protein R2864_08830 [Syntrophotaleaceae bacterium]
MNFNPVTKITAKLEQLIIEHGSAVVQQKHISLLKEQLSFLEQKFSSIEQENTDLKTELENLRIENSHLKDKIQTYENSSHSNLLDEVKIKILKFLSTKPKSIPREISQALGSEEEATEFHLQEMQSDNFVKRGTTRKERGRLFTCWSLDQEGRRFLVENQMLS